MRLSPPHDQHTVGALNTLMVEELAGCVSNHAVLYPHPGVYGFCLTRLRCGQLRLIVAMVAMVLSMLWVLKATPVHLLKRITGHRIGVRFLRPPTRGSVPFNVGTVGPRPRSDRVFQYLKYWFTWRCLNTVVPILCTTTFRSIVGTYTEFSCEAHPILYSGVSWCAYAASASSAALLFSFRGTPPAFPLPLRVISPRKPVPLPSPPIPWSTGASLSRDRRRSPLSP